MMTCRRLLLLPALCLGLAACGAYDPPVAGDRAAAQYKTDLGACRTQSRHAVYLKNAATLGRWLISPITGPPAVRRQIRSCMQAKGYTLLPRAD